MLKLLKSLKAHKAPGPVQLSPHILKEMANVIAPISTEIFKKSFDSGVVPEDWKAANINLVFKKCKTFYAANYRPLSLTGMACKLMKHILTSHIMKHITTSFMVYSIASDKVDLVKHNWRSLLMT